MHYRTVTLSLTAALLAALALPAADAPFDPQAAVKLLTPYLDPQTVAVARLDVAGLDTGPAVDRVAKLAGVDANALAAPRRAVTGFLSAVRDAGARELYAVVSLADLPMPGPYLLVPRAEGVKVEELRKALTVMGAQVVEPLDGVVFAGGKATRERLRGMKPADRPDLAAAFAAVAGAPVQVVVVPGAEQRRVFEELLPRLPQQVGGGPGTVLTHGARWLALGLKAKPKLALKLTAQAEDATAAEALAKAVGNGLRWVAGQEEVKKAFPAVGTLVPALTPAVRGNRLTVEVDESAAAVAQASAALVARARSAAGRSQSANNLKQIALAWHNYLDVNKTFPADIRDKDGKPLLSWRVAILPFIEQDNLYKQFKLDEPWDSEHNKKLIPLMPATFRSPAQKAGDGKTTCLAPRGETGAKGEVKIGVLGARIQDVTDGTSNTILVLETGDGAAVEWTKPADLDVDVKQPLKGLLGHYGGDGFLAAFADGSVRFISGKITPQTLNAVFTRNGGEVVGKDL
jgi:hypothetical protein